MRPSQSDAGTADPQDMDSGHRSIVDVQCSALPCSADNLVPELSQPLKAAVLNIELAGEPPRRAYCKCIFLAKFPRDSECSPGMGPRNLFLINT